MTNVTDALPPPSQCDCCCSVNIELTKNDRIYGRIYGDWPWCYFCNDCGAAVGCHPNTFIPLGRLAGKKTRQLRAKAHKEFDQLWRSGLMSRPKAYRWLAGRLGIEPSQCHMSQLPDDQLKLTAQICAEYLNENAEALQRRKQKERAEYDNRDKRTASHIRRRKAR